jgi:putative ABC transport system permease protein
MRYLALSPWRRAPWRALSIASLSIGVALASFVLGLAAASRPMFISSAASGALQTDIDACRFAVGLSLGRNVRFGDDPADSQLQPAPALATADGAVATATTDISGVDRVRTILGPRAQVSNGGTDYQLQLWSRADFLDHIDVESRVAEAGIWLPDTISDLIGVTAGDTVQLGFPAGTQQMVVAGTFADLARGGDQHWCSLVSELAEQQGRPVPPPTALVDESTLMDLLGRAGINRGLVLWELAPPSSGWDLDDAQRAEQAMQRVVGAAGNDADPLGQAIGSFGGGAVADSAGSIRHAERTKRTVSSAAGPIALATAGVALLVLLTAARSWLDRRRREVTVLALRGAGPIAIAGKAVLELALPIVLGAAAGVATSVVLVQEIGPSTRIDAGAVSAGILQVGAAIAVTAIALGAVVAAAVRRVASDPEGAAPRRTLLWWEPPVLLLAAAALYEVRTRGANPGGADDVDSLALLFPFLLLAGGSGLLARVGLSRRVIGLLAPRLPMAGWLAARRLAARRLRAIAVVASAAVATGVVVFAGSMASSIRSTAEAKELLAPGAEQVVRLSIRDTVPSGIGGDGHTTVVTRQSETGVLVRGHPSADVLGVEPATFADAAYWDASFAGSSLGSLLDRLAPAPVDGALPAIAAGDGLPDRFVLYLPPDDGGADVEVEVRIVGRAKAFPGLGFRQDRPLVVVDRSALTAAGVTRFTEVWSDAAAPAVVDRLEEQDIRPVSVIVAEDETSESTVRAALWAVSYLELIGLAAALVTLAGLGLYFAASLARHRLGSQVAGRLGMRRRSGIAASAFEVAALLLAGWLAGTVLSWIAARLVYTSFDPRPNSPPAALFRFGLAQALWTGVAALAVAAAAAAVIESGRRSLTRMLRDDD